MLARIFAILVLFPVTQPAFGLEACFVESVGSWRGPVWNGSGIQTMDTELHAEPDGTLAGSYHIDDAEPFDGTLTGFRQTGDCEADFTWKDRFGTGAVHIRFEPDLGRFLGYWGTAIPILGLIFDGYRVGPPIVS